MKMNLGIMVIVLSLAAGAWVRADNQDRGRRQFAEAQNRDTNTSAFYRADGATFIMTISRNLTPAQIQQFADSCLTYSVRTQLRAASFDRFEVVSPNGSTAITDLR